MKKVLALVVLVALPGCGGGSTPSAPTTPQATLAPAPVEVTARYASKDVPRDIPNRTRTLSTLVITDNGTIMDMSVEVSITHTWRGDVDVYLRHPDGTQVDLFRGDPYDGRDDIVDTYTVAKAPQLARILGKSLAGTWTLVVDDTQAQDKGRLLEWALTVRVRR